MYLTTMNLFKLLAITFFCMFLLSRGSVATISCSDVTNDLQPCLTYLISGSGKPPADCCVGVKALAAAAKTAEDRKAACECIKSASQSIAPKADLVQGLAGNCGVSSPINVSPNVDCSRVG